MPAEMGTVAAQTLVLPGSNEAVQMLMASEGGWLVRQAMVQIVAGTAAWE